MAATSKDGPELHMATVELAQGRNYGAITTVLPSGRLQTHPIWVGTDGERLVVNTETHRQKYKKLQRELAQQYGRVSRCNPVGTAPNLEPPINPVFQNRSSVESLQAPKH